MSASATLNSFVAETAFGNWFLKSATWKQQVLCRALDDLQRMRAVTSVRQVLDVGCGFGLSFDELAGRFSPSHIFGLDAEPNLTERAGQCAQNCACPVSLIEGNAAQMPWPDGHFDMVFCHQTFHHIVAQKEAMAEFFRVLAPGGVLLFAESTKRYIHSLPIRILFRHPMEVQRTAEEYVDMIRAAGFDLPAERISYPYLWWSRSDLGFLERLGFKVPAQREETLVNAVAVKPLRS